MTGSISSVRTPTSFYQLFFLSDIHPTVKVPLFTSSPPTSFTTKRLNSSYYSLLKVTLLPRTYPWVSSTPRTSVDYFFRFSCCASGPLLPYTSCRSFGLDSSYSFSLLFTLWLITLPSITFQKPGNFPGTTFQNSFYYQNRSLLILKYKNFLVRSTTHPSSDFACPHPYVSGKSPDSAITSTLYYHTCHRRSY